MSYIKINYGENASTENALTNIWIIIIDNSLTKMGYNFTIGPRNEWFIIFNGSIFQGPDWQFQTRMPDWAEENWSGPHDG